ncbi:alpha-L-arabinofuranosidase C-terminal domain-containing protein [Halomarina pelagica]|uniref:alpha-L-arabinofuranosidase C-terminal domain-containing protein n=1 Tax=Halomarina pelagica TaxID=2961599 RepID=UPI0020C3BDAF|nr:alpha-L-arabinofuranosidase C-terminal domain-containing protein [Halomarina sp. BND7]
MTERQLLRHRDAGDPAEATIRVTPAVRGDAPVTPFLLGKFCEHLGRNVYNGMDAQILLNPTFGRWEFPVGDDHPDGGIQPEHDPNSLRVAIERYCERWDLPHPVGLWESYRAGGAFGWLPAGGATLSPEVGRAGDRAQRVSGADGTGLRQYTHLPLHRTRTYELGGSVRATEATAVEVSVHRTDDDARPTAELARVEVPVGRAWTTIDSEITLPEDADAPLDDAFCVTVAAEGDADLVLDRLTLSPDDHLHGADPEVIAYLRAADLPLLRWPGGNFASGYRWRDGVGPLDERPSRVNPAWGRAESNLFGTDEFLRFCETVDCEPMICVNAGDGRPEDAAAWVEYCNGSTETEMGALRADHGHPEPYGVTFWEIGNELFGRWQVGWTTPAGNADRYRRFREAMLAADPDVEIVACGNRTSPESRWNEELLTRAGADAAVLSDHVLTGGAVSSATDGDELFRAFLGYADQLGREYRELRDRMAAVGVDAPGLAITELQLFADFVRDREVETHGGPLSPETMPTRTTISEPLYDATILHECIRMGEFVRLVTHSATVNHGGGLRKRRERTWADPAHYGHVLLKPLAGGTPLGIDLACGTVSTGRSFGRIDAFDGVPAVDPMAVLAADGSAVHLSLVNRRSGEPISLSLDVEAVTDGGTAAVTTLDAETMHAENTYETPERVSPSEGTASIRDGRLSLSLPPFSLTRVTVPASDP